ncbi:hypothetical protein [Reyranella sp.]|uniref:hypothetical protein n=1 Tax=Reyranella sp. TaxID=1929291 RepID=UPI003BAD9371
MRHILRLLAVVLYSLFGVASAAASNCTTLATALDTAICNDPQLLSLYDAVAKRFGDLKLEVNRAGERQGVLFDADQLGWREDLREACKPPTADCLLPKLEQRLKHLNALNVEAIHALYDAKGIRFGDGTLEYRKAPQSGLYFGEHLIVPDGARIEYLDRYTDRTADALAFMINWKGNGIFCEPYGIFIVVARSGHPSEVLQITKDDDWRLREWSCVGTIARFDGGFRHEVAPAPWFDGAVSMWTPGGGFRVVDTLRFAPIAGTTIKDLLANERFGDKLRNEQFYRALRTASDGADVSFTNAANAFAWSWKKPFELDDYVVYGSCMRPGRGERCFGDYEPRAVYDRLSDRLFFIFPDEKLRPRCESEPGGEAVVTEGTLRAARYFPPRARWPEGAFVALTQSYCRGD